MNKILKSIVWFFSNPKCVFWLGFAVVFASTLIEALRCRNTNYMDYHDSTMYLWAGLSPYNMEYVNTRGIYFLYTPIFNIVFAPIFFLHHMIAPFVWNVGNYCLTFLAVWTLPEYFRKYRVPIFLSMLLVLEQGLFSCQVNIVLCYIALFAFTLLERGHAFWAVLLITFSLCTKIYGGIELGLLFCYPKVWRNFGYAALCCLLWILLPAVVVGWDGLMQTYGDWISMINSHHSDSDFCGILFAYGLKWLLLPNYRVVQGLTLCILMAMFFVMHKRWNDLRFRTHVFAVMMGYVILFSDCPETHTYVISLPGYLMCYFAIWNEGKLWDKVLFWGLIVFMGVMPIDVFCPVWIHDYVNNHFFVDIYLYFFIWLTMIYRTITLDYGKNISATEPAVVR